MKSFLNIIESILLALCIFLVVVAVTLLNKNYIKHEFKIHGYYELIISKMNDSSIDTEAVKKDVNNYINNYFYDNKYSSKINSEDNTDDIYNENIKLIKPIKDFRLFRDIFDLITIAIIIGTGILFIKTKKKHNIQLIFIISGIISMIGSLIVLLNIKFDDIINPIIKDYYYIYLYFSIFMILIPIYLNVFNRIVKKK